jgi:hypothetical protein
MVLKFSQQMKHAQRTKKYRQNSAHYTTLNTVVRFGEKKLTVCLNHVLIERRFKLV